MISVLSFSDSNKKTKIFGNLGILGKCEILSFQKQEEIEKAVKEHHVPGTNLVEFVLTFYFLILVWLLL